MASRRASATLAIRAAARPRTSRRYWSQRETTIGANLMPPDLSGLPRLVRASGNAARHHSFVGEGGLEPPRPCGHRNLNPARLPIPPLARCRDDSRGSWVTPARRLRSRTDAVAPSGQFTPQVVLL